MKTITIYRDGYEFQYSPDYRNFRFKGGGGSVQPPKVEKVEPIPPLPPTAIPDTSPETEEQARKRRPRDRQKTFLTGDLVPLTDKKKVLG